MKKRVRGLGDFFFKSKDPKNLKPWYSRQLGVTSTPYGKVFPWHPMGKPDKVSITNWSIMSENTRYLDPSQQSFMINYRIEDLDELLKLLKAEGVSIIGEPETLEYGKFAWVLDPDGNKIELWGPIDEAFDLDGELTDQ